MLPVTAIGGYLGSGKTTLVNHLLRNADGRKLAVLVNEFGQLPIDEDLIEAQDDTLISITGGCVCCSYGNDLIEAMMNMLRMEPRPDHILIEASGVALPGGIAASVSLMDGFELDGVVVMTDAETVRRQAANDYIGDTIERQLSDADLVLLNKADLVSASQLQDLETWMETNAPQAGIVRTVHGEVPTSVILQRFDPDLARFSGATHDSIAAFASEVLDFSGIVDADACAQTFADPCFNLVRAKGFVPTVDGLRAIQVVGRRWAVSDAPEDAVPGVVLIAAGAKLDLAGIKKALGDSVA